MTIPKHIVAVAGLVTDAQGRVLMLQSPRGDWEFPGGQVEEGEDLTAALVREIEEETGITVAVGGTGRRLLQSQVAYRHAGLSLPARRRRSQDKF